MARLRWEVYGLLDEIGTWVVRGDVQRRRTRDQRRIQRLDMFEELSFGAELLALCGLAIAQPVLDVFARSPEWFAYRGARAGDIVTFALLVTLLPPLILWAVQAPLRLVSRPVRRGVHLVAMGGLVALLLLQGLRGVLSWSPPVLIAVSFGLGAVVAVLYPSVRALRTWMLVLAVAPLGFMALFLGNSATGDLVFASDEVELAASRAEAPVVVLVLDELPTASLVDAEGAIDEVRYPNLARFAEDATWYRNFTALSGSTVHSVPSILSGLDPEKDSNPFWFEHPDNLFTLLGGSHRLHVWEVMTQLCAPSLCRDGGLARSADHDGIAIAGDLLGDARSVWSALIRPDGELPDPQVLFDEDQLAAGSVQSSLVAEAIAADDDPVPWSDLEDDRQLVSQPQRFSQFLDSLEPQLVGEPPGLHLAHVLLPHRPWHYFPDGTEYAEPDRPLVAGDLRYPSDAPWHALVQRQRMIVQTQYADGLVGQMLDRLEESGLYEEALVVVVADHGVSFTPGEGVRKLTAGNEHEIMWAPLLVKAPGQEEPLVTDVDADTTDVLPTVADLLDVDIPWHTDGSSLTGATAAAQPRGPKTYYWFEDVATGGDEVLEIDAPAGFAAMLDDVFPAAAGRNDWVGGLYDATPYGDLVDRPMSELDLGGTTQAIALVDDLAQVRDADRPLRADVVGAIQGSVAPGVDHVAVALNGRIVGVSPLEPFGDDAAAFDVLVHPAQFVRSGNRLDVFEIRSVGGEVQLAPMRLRAR